MKFNHDQARRFLELLDEEAEVFTFQTIGNNKEDSKAETIHGSLEDLGPKLAALNEFDGRGIYVTINETDGKIGPKGKVERKAENITRIRAFFADIDGTLDNPASFISHELTPTFTVKTGKGQHAYWVLREFISATNENAKRFVDIQKRIIAFYNSDGSIKDLPRVMRIPGSLHSKGGSEFREIELLDISNDYYTIEEIEEAFPALKPGRPKSTGSDLARAIGLKRGILLPAVEEFLSLKWGGTTNDHVRFVAAVANMKKNSYAKEECIEALTGKGEKVDFKSIGQINAIYKDDVKYPIMPYYGRPEKWDMKELVYSSRIFREENVPGFVHVVNEDAGVCRKLCIDNVKIILQKGFTGKVEFCSLTYNPTTTKKILQDEDGLTLINTYRKPKFYDYLDPSVNKLPAPYAEFFHHMFPDRESLEYVLNWIAFSIRQGKNVPILSLCGTVRGLGKGNLGRIISTLHGEDNSAVSGQSLLSKEFNADVYGKTFIFLDEVSIENDSHLESIKAYTNTRIRVEGKGVDSSAQNFYGNLMIANNRSDSLRGVKAIDDRQFSVPVMNDRALDYVSIAKKYGAKTQDVRFLWEDMGLITQLASYLFNKDLSKYDSMQNFKSAHYHEVIKDSMLEWQRFLLEEFREKHCNHIVRLHDVQTLIASVFKGTRPGQHKFREFAATQKSSIYYKEFGKISYLIFAKEDEEQDDFIERAKKCHKDDLMGFERVKNGETKYLGDLKHT